MSPTERLIEALIESEAPPYMIERARSGRYDRLRTPIEQLPMKTLVDDAILEGLTPLALRAWDGEFDAVKGHGDFLIQG